MKSSPISAATFVLILVSLVEAKSSNLEANDRRVARVSLEITETPYITQIRRADGSLICSGAVLNFLYILTTASCVNGYEADDLTVVVGTDGLNAGTFYSLTNVISHENFVPDDRDRLNDIAMLKLARYLRYNTAVRPIPIPEIHETEIGQEGSSAVASGWSISSTLKKIRRVINGVNECRRSYASLGVSVNDDYICATTVVSENDEDGNDGSPLVQDSKLIGLKSWSTSGFPDVYTRVAHYRDWIEENNLA
ncbi:trypsin-3-like [Neodiprion fabricii]|uniref:trypsin-3-like n=1 Tax=Neodiprion fabricii TaxID=2872261 RepID=UPI001ED9316C|nr:trypsin-3-like [Neodiprion fabricii]